MRALFIAPHLSAVFIILLTFTLDSPSLAHIFAPSLYELKETGPETVTAKWKEPVIRPKGSILRPVLPPDCDGVGRVNLQYIDSGAIATWELKCTGGLIGKTLSVEGIGSSKKQTCSYELSS